MTTVDLPLVAAGGERVGEGLDFLWLELTNRCNLQCVHCYTESGPQTGALDVLTNDDYLSVMSQAYALGCRRMQFIGGEPQLNRDFHRLLVASKEIGFEFVEVFSNLTRLDERTLRFAQGAGICFATSVYSDDPATHGAITTNASSHARTIRNLKRLIDRGVPTRAAVIVIDQEAAEVERTKRFLAELGVGHARASEVREFGRGEEILDRSAQMSGLCGHCWSGRLCVAPDGSVYPCVMARRWPVGNVLERPLADMVHGEALAAVRATIHDTVWLPKLASGARVSGHAGEGEPDRPDDPEAPDYGEPTPAECPQSCGPDLSTPGHCPQSCEPFIVVCEPTEPTTEPEEEEIVREDAPEPPGYEEPTPAECPQSCVPDTIAPKCPQSCEPFIAVCEPTEPDPVE